MNRFLLLFYCMTACLVSGIAQVRVPQPLVLQQLLKKELPDTADIRILLEAGDAYIMRPGIESGDVDTAKLCAEKVLWSAAKENKHLWEGQADLLYAKIWRELNNAAKGKEYALKAMKILEKEKNKTPLAATYIELSEYYSNWIDADVKIKMQYYREAAKIYGQEGLKLKQANTLMRLGDYCTILPDYNAAKIVLLQSLAIYQEINYKELQSIYDLVGTTYYHLGNSDSALKYALLSVKTLEALKDSTPQFCTTYNRLGMVYNSLNDDQKAMAAFQKSLDIAFKLKDTLAMQYLTANIARSYRKLDKGEEALRIVKRWERDYPAKDFYGKAWMSECIIVCYCALGRYDEARPYAQHLEEVSRKISPDNSFLEQLNGPLAEYYLGIHQGEKAHLRGLLQLASAKKNKEQSLQAAACVLLYKADSATGNFKEALEHFRMYKIINDSLFTIAKMRQISNLQVEFETEQKDQAIKLKEQNIELLMQEAQLQKAELRSTRFTRNVIIAGAAMLAALLILGYNRYQLKLYSNRRLKKQQDEINYKNLSLLELIASQSKLLGEKEWLLREIHHRVKNNLQIVMSLLNTQAAFLDDKDALNAIRESRYRMQAISLIHQKLYQSENMALIDMPMYIRDLVEYLKDGFLDVNKIKFELDIAPVKLDVSQSVPIGLILNEAITNAIKYAFTNRGTVCISLQPSGPGQLTLIIADNGMGFPEGEVPAERGSMGMMLMNTLAEQLDGTLNIACFNGVIITVSFKYENKEQCEESLEMEESIERYA